MNKSRMAYIAGPLFSEGERYFLQQIDQICQKLNVKTFLPHRDADHNQSQKNIFDLNIENLKKCDILVAVLDGSDVDSGTAFEIGFCFQLHKFIIGIRTDYRKTAIENVPDPLAAEVNLMIQYSLNRFCTNLYDFKRLLKEYIETNY